MCPAPELDPVTGLFKIPDDKGIQSLPPTKTEVVKPSDIPVHHEQDKAASISGADVKDSQEPVQNNPSTVIGEVVKDENKDLTREEFHAKVDDILKRYTSDSQSYLKAKAELAVVCQDLSFPELDPELEVE